LGDLAAFDRQGFLNDLYLTLWDICMLQLKKEAEQAWEADKNTEGVLTKPSVKKVMHSTTKRVEQFRKNMRRWMIGVFFPIGLFSPVAICCASEPHPLLPHTPYPSNTL
jgi:hypothetical protein